MTRSPHRELLLAAASGLLLGVAFLPLPAAWLAWVAYVPLLAALDARVRRGDGGRSLFLVGYAFGFVFFLIGTHWIALLSDVAITVPPLKYLGWLLAGAYLGLFGGATTWLAGWLARRASLSVAWSFPVAALVVEELRGSGELGFPWFQPGYTQHAFAPVLQLASLGGVTLVTLWVLAANAAAWRAWRTRTRGAALAAAALLVSPWPIGLALLAGAPREDGPPIALVQGNIPGEKKWSGRHQGEILATFLALSDSAARSVPSPTLVIWPETATGSYLRRQPDQAIAVARFANRTGVPVFTGYADASYDSTGRARPTNSAGLFRPDGTTSEPYSKRHLVPFGERMPFQWLFPQLGRVDLGQAEWAAGTKTVLFPSAAGPFSCLICFESIFPDLARADVRAGARWLVNVTNDEWFGRSAALHQHAAMAPFRAAENHVPLARCANTGVTEILDAYGRVRARAPIFEPAILVGRLPTAGPATPFTRLGDWPGVLAMALAFAFALAPWRRASRAAAR